METPSSTRRVTRSQALAAASNSNTNNIPVSNRVEDSEKALPKSRQRNVKQQDRSALIDITNDSPIVGLASGNIETPLSSIIKQKGSRVKKTPGSGEALLRGQVKTLLQKVEEEAELSKLSLESRPFLQLVNSPMGLLAPTPANTPEISNLSGDGCGNNSTGLASVTPPPTVEEQLISQVMNHIFEGKNQESSDSEKSLTRSLLLDFSEKSEVSDASECLSELSFQEVVQGRKEKPSTEDDDASIWSIQVNASTHDEEEEEEENYEDIEEEEEEEEEEDGRLLDELCEGMNKISVNERVAPKFAGKYTRFDYNSDDELVAEKEDIEEEEEEENYEDIEEEEEEEEEEDGRLLDELCEGMNKISVNERVAPKFAGKYTRFDYNSDDELVAEKQEEEDSVSPNVLHLKGLPTPKGKHLRFPDKE